MDVDLSESLQVLLTELIGFIPNLIVALITFVVTLILTAPVTRWVRKAAKRKIDNEETILLLVRLVRWSLIILGTILALEQVNFDVTGFVAGLGVAGITIGFALQDIARNFVAGVLLFVRQPFQIGDAVQVAGYSGSVQEITSRDTVIMTWDGERVILANTDVLSNPIINYSNLPRRRRAIQIGLGYGQDMGRAIEVFQQAIEDVPGVLLDPAPSVYADSLGDAAMTLLARFWVDPETHGLFDVHSDVVLAVNTVAEQEGIDLPYPIQTVRVMEVE